MGKVGIHAESMTQEVSFIDDKELKVLLEPHTIYLSTAPARSV